MKEIDRKQHATRNAVLTASSMAVKLVFQFLNRTVFVYVLGAKILGLNGLLTSLLGFLSLAEVGVGPAIVFALYKPLAEGDSVTVRTLLKLFKKSYTIIALVFLGAGILLFPFLPTLISGYESLAVNIGIVYILFLLNTVVSYLMAHYRTIFDAAQMGRVNQVNQMIVFVGASVLQIAFLLITGDYYLYLILQLITTLLGNILIRRKARKMFGDFFIGPTRALKKNETTQIVKNILGNFSNSIGYYAVTGTDNILISKFLSLAMVGLYSNYVLVISNITNFSTNILNSTVSGIGNFVAANNTDTAAKKNLFERYSFVNFVLLLIVNGSLMLQINPLIEIWLGEKYKLSAAIVLLIVTNSIVGSLRNPSVAFISAMGLAWRQKWKSLFEATINLSISLLLLVWLHWGLEGILVGTLVSYLVVFAYEPYVAFKFGLQVPVRIFFHLNLKFFIWILLIVGPAFFAGLHVHNFLSMIASEILYLGYAYLLVVLGFKNTLGFVYMKTLVVELIRKLSRKRKK